MEAIDRALWNIRFERTNRRANGDDDRKVYFILSETGAVKIGMSAAPSHRIKDLQAKRNDRLSLLAQCGGGFKLEQDLHREFQDIRIGKSEWFEPNQRLWDRIRELTGYEHVSNFPNQWGKIGEVR